MKFLEKDLESIIFETDNDKLQEIGFNIEGKKFRQLRIGNYGISDIITVSRYGQNLHIEIIELKKDVISTDTLIQSLRYLAGIKNFLKRRKFTNNVFYTIKLCGKSINNLRDLSLLCCNMTTLNSGIEYIQMMTYSYDFDGLKFEEHYEHITDSFGESIAFGNVFSKKKEYETFDLF